MYRPPLPVLQNLTFPLFPANIKQNDWNTLLMGPLSFELFWLSSCLKTLILKVGKGTLLFNAGQREMPCKTTLVSRFSIQVYHFHLCTIQSEGRK